MHAKIVEKFEDISDPIKDMGIGVQNAIKNLVHKCFELNDKENRVSLYEVEIQNDRLVFITEDDSLDKGFSIVSHIKKLVAESGLDEYVEPNKIQRWTGSDHVFIQFMFLPKYKNVFKISIGINEVFTDDSDPVKDMGIGIQHKIEKWIKHIGDNVSCSIIGHRINKDGTIDAVDVDLSSDFFAELPFYIHFNLITNHFSCNIKTLENFKLCGPKQVWGDLLVFGKNKDYTKEDIRKICEVKGEIKFITI